MNNTVWMASVAYFCLLCLLLSWRCCVEWDYILACRNVLCFFVSFFFLLLTGVMCDHHLCINDLIFLHGMGSSCMTWSVLIVLLGMNHGACSEQVLCDATAASYYSPKVFLYPSQSDPDSSEPVSSLYVWTFLLHGTITIINYRLILGTIMRKFFCLSYKAPTLLLLMLCMFYVVECCACVGCSRCCSSWPCLCCCCCCSYLLLLYGMNNKCGGCCVPFFFFLLLS